MKDIRLITRADDAGSSHSANAAIAQVVKHGFIRNVSVMAPCEFVDEAAAMLAGNSDVCFGMHATLNAEWDKVKWAPVSDIPSSSGLTDKDRNFLADPKMFRETKPPLELVMQELEAQLDVLARAGFNITYIDSHMFPEMHIPGLDDAIADFAKRKGLLDHMYYYALPTEFIGPVRENSSMSILRNMPDGQYFFVTHPAVYSEEMLRTGNKEHSGEEIARQRGDEAESFSMVGIRFIMRMFGIRPLRYIDAEPLPQRPAPVEIMRLFS